MRRLNCHRPLGAQQTLTPEKELLLLTDASWENDRKRPWKERGCIEQGTKGTDAGMGGWGGQRHTSYLLGDLISRMPTIPGLPTAPTTVTRTQHKLLLPIKLPPQDAKYDLHRGGGGAS